MYTDEVRTPQAIKTSYYSNFSEVKCRSNNKGEYCAVAASSRTPTNAAKQKTRCSPKVPTVCTPPPKRFHKIRNPFEGALTDRLHLPLIGSPSLFQCRTRTPQLSSTQFEWDIEEVSQLKPADVEPHETQFHDSPDPEQESKAQLAISTFFKESHIVPSPVDCPLRNRRIILSEINVDTPISNKSGSKRSKDCEVQTELTLPPVLPKSLEDALRPYFQPHLAGSRQLLRNSSCGDIFNSSMRRKLFDLHNVIVLGEADATGQQTDQALVVGSSPQAKQTMFAGRLSDSTGEGSNSFGCLSPIRNLCGLPPGTPDDGNGTHSPRKRKQLLHELDLPSPIAPSEHLSRRLHSVVHSKSNYRELSNNSEHVTLSELTSTDRTATQQCIFTPDRSSSPMQVLEYSTDSSINQRVSRLRVNSTRQMPGNSMIEEVELPIFESADDYIDGAEEEDDLETDEDESMQISRISTNSFNCSSSNSDTPRGHRRQRSANRKNLSQSFSANNANWSKEEDQLEPAMDIQSTNKIQPNVSTVGDSVVSGVTAVQSERVTFYRTDSGFNETSSTFTFACSQELQANSNTYDCTTLDESMVRCSTPSTRH